MEATMFVSRCGQEGAVNDQTSLQLVSDNMLRGLLPGY